MWPHSWTSSLQNGVAWEWGQPTHIHLQAPEIHTYTCYLYKYELMLHSFTGERAGNAGEQLLVRSDQHMHSHMLPPSHYTHTHMCITHTRTHTGASKCSTSVLPRRCTRLQWQDWFSENQKWRPPAAFQPSSWNNRQELGWAVALFQVPSLRAKPLELQ